MIRVHRLKNGTLSTTDGTADVKPPAGDERLWCVVSAPSEGEVRALLDGLPVHELAVEDALNEGHPPKLEDFEDHLFFIAHTPGTEDPSATRKLAVFLGAHWIVSISRRPLGLVGVVEARVAQDPRRLLAAPERIAHAVLDHMLDEFEHLADDLVERGEALESAALVQPTPALLEDLLETRRATSHLLRVLRAQRDVCQALSRSSHKVLSRRMTPYLRDVYDHALRVHDLVEGVRESLSATREAYLSTLNNRLSETMRVLTVIATIMMPLGVVAGVFGMNFDQPAFLHAPVGFWVTLGAMGAMAFVMLLWFRRRGWI